MPTLFRLLTILALVVGIVYGAMHALVFFVKPNKGEMIERVPVDRLMRDK
ncbi:MAG: histidine kinase [Mesorhizobium sp.]|nr:histidine kinase [Mesorhizobium sp.]MCO5162186.1 histidine kinase [Mesorhizobium sp.]